MALREAETERQFATQHIESERLLIEAEARAERSLAVAHANAERHHFAMDAEIKRVVGEAENLHAMLNKLQATVDYMISSKSWKLTAPLRALLFRLRPSKIAEPAIPVSENSEADANVEVYGDPSPASDPAVATLQLSPSSSATEKIRQRLALGLDLAMPTLNVAVGIVTYNTDEETLLRCLSSVDLARSSGGLPGDTLIIYNGRPSAAWRGSVRLNFQGNIGFGRGHNVLMREAFARGADVYLAVNPDGALHHKALEGLARVIVAHDGRALVEACQFPAEHPKQYDPITLETSWVSAACLAIPRSVFDVTQGFDDAFFMYCEDVDLSWRVRAAGMKVLIAPHALFLHPVTNRTGTEAMWRMMLESAVILGRKWGNLAFADDAASKLVELGAAVPETFPAPVKEAWQSIPDF